MRLTRLEINGFKSFAKRTELIFEPGITGILGPNGCGKSNISDAFRFVLGEQSARALRGKKVEDFIFGGTESRRPLSFCQVSMSFDNSDGKLASPYSEVVVSRHAFRSGESEYFINKTPCRLKDILELFHDTGIGKDGYSIIGQGRVSDILSDRSGERREVFEEAVGVMKYRSRKEESERKLQNTKKNLTRLDDIIFEVESRLEPLRVDSEKAIEYFKYREELKSLELNLFIYQYDKSNERIASVKQTISVYSSSINEAVATESKLNSFCSKLDDEQRKLSEDLNDLSHKLIEMSSNVESSIGHERLLHERKSTLETEIKQKKDQARELSEQLSHAEEELKSIKSLYSSGQSDCETYRKELNVAEENFSFISNTILEREKLLEESKQSMMTSLNRIADAKSRIARLEAMRSGINDRLRAIETEKETLTSEATSLFEELGEADKEINEIRKKRECDEAKYSEATKQLDSVNEIIKRASYELRSKENELNSLHSKLKVLEELKSVHEGYYSSVKRLLNDCANNNSLASHICGVVAELISVPTEFETAIEMVVSSALQDIVVPSEYDAKFLIEYLRKHQYGRATFLPVSNIHSKLLNNYELNQTKIDGSYGVASELISYSSEYKGIMENLFGRIVIVKDLDVGIELSRRTKAAFKIVTLKGDILNSGGSLTGGSVQKREVSILGREREIDSLKSDYHQIEEVITKINNDIDSYKESVAVLSVTVKEIADRFQEYNVLLASAKERTDIVKKYIERNADSTDKFNMEVDQLNDSLSEIEEQINETLSVQSGLSEGSTVTNDDIRKLQEELTSLRSKLQSANDTLATVRVKLNSSEKEVSTSANELNKLMAEIDKKKQLIIEYNNFAIATAEAISNIDMEIKELTEKSDKERLKFESLKQEQKRIESEIETKLSLLDEKRNERETVSHQLIDLRERQHKSELNLNRIQLEVNSLCDRIWQDYELTYENALPYRKEISVTQSHMRVDELKQSIKALGTVNTGSIEEYKELCARHEELTAQCNDLRHAESDLTELISRLTTTMEHEFAQQFKIIQKNFSETFTALFNGGKAELILSDTNDVLNCDIDIIAQPPGKKLQLLTLLSGGEQALTAIALLFAILKLKPTAFCILDEIDTSLDETNVENFARYLKDYSKDTQFIVITHRKGSMAVCNALYGVSMEEKGVSTIVSAKFND